MQVKKTVEAFLAFGVLIYFCFLLYLSKPESKTNVRPRPFTPTTFAYQIGNEIDFSNMTHTIISTDTPAHINNSTSNECNMGLNTSVRRVTEQTRVFEEKFESRRNIVQHLFKVSSHLEKRALMSTSNLGSILFKYKDAKTFIHPSNKTYTVLMWREKRIRQKKPLRYQPAVKCAVRNCIFTNKENALDTADAVVVNISDGLVPRPKTRNAYQRWIFLIDPTEINNFTVSDTDVPLDRITNKFNWSMSYLSYSDIPLPRGRTVLLNKEQANVTYEEILKLVPYWKFKTNTVKIATVVNDCDNTFISDILNHLASVITIDIYGPCTNNTPCSDFFSEECTVLNKYVFYLVFEDFYCKEYITRDTFYYSYLKGAIPLIAGVPISDCIRLLPPLSYLHLAHFRTYKEIKDVILRIVNTPLAILKLHYWRKYLKFRDDQVFYNDPDFLRCRVCEALNYNKNSTKMYSFEDLLKYFHQSELCNTEGSDWKLRLY